MSKKAMRIFVGSLFLVLGVAGLFLPVLQGVLFLALGALILSVDVPLFTRMVCLLERWYPNITRYTRRLRSWLGAEECEMPGPPQEPQGPSDQALPRR